MVHPGTDNFWSRGLVWGRRPFYLGVYLVMRATELIAAALLVAAVAVTAFGPGMGEAREHILQSDTVTVKREHIL